MNDPRLVLFQRLVESLASLETTFAALSRGTQSEPRAEPSPGLVGGPPEPSAIRNAPRRRAAGEPFLRPEEQDRIVRQLRTLRDEVRALGEALQDPPLDS